MSQALIEPPGWPLCTLCVMRTMCFRRVTAFRFSAAMSSSVTSTTDRPRPRSLPGRSRQDARGLRTSLAALASQNSTSAVQQDRRDDEGGDEDSTPGEKHGGESSDESNPQEEDKEYRLPLPAIESPPRGVRMSGLGGHGPPRRTNG